jgi:hypothetical protein
MRKLFGFSRFWAGTVLVLSLYLFAPRRSPALELANSDLRIGANRSVRPAHKEPPAKARPEIIAFEREKFAQS